YFGQGYGPYVYDDVACSSAETSLISCNSRALGSTNCAGSNDAGIGCSGTITSSCTNGAVKLWRPSDGPEYFGLALYCKNSRWTGVCDDSFTCHTARLICEQLGYPGALYYRGEGYWGYFYSTLGNNGVDHYACCNAYHDQFGIMCTPKDQKSECTTGTVRLVNGTSSNNGRVEYCFDGGWASLCGLSAPASTAVCRTLGFNTSFASIYNDERYGRNNNPSSLSYLSCPTSATHVNQCTAIRKGNGGCWRSVSRCGKEYSVQCYNNIGECTEGSFRLVNGTIEQEGRVEICTNGLWGAICHGSWNSIDAFVLCRSLGYGGSGPTTYWTSTFGLATGPAPWKNVLCYGWENTLFDCQKTIYPYDSCPVQNTVGVACKDGCANGQVRLVGGNFENEGTIQVCYSGRWGQVSDQGWDANGARVVCNQLGYTGGNAVPTTGSSYGKSNLTIHLKFVACSGNEINIDLCSKTKLSLNNGKKELVTAQVAGVDCIYDAPTDPPCIATPPLYNTQGSQCGAAQNRTVRMNPDDPPGNGRVQYCYNGYWSPFCNMDPITASIACNDLGYTSYSWGSIIDNGNYATPNLMNISLFDR
ncbi:PREDICTED: scavenger receptor cysteine-rich domain superfamily protein-like, partial [Amphimedon queenslandica]|uniref:SRCR domain-containing protein n=1 Tax=Amphimedon queenslandica TaxID=400682 RepID=A0AAN0IS89_AMPQE